MTIATILAGKGAEVVSVSPEATVKEVVAMLAHRRIGAVPVVAGGEVVGILSERDLVYGLASDGAAMLEKAVGEVMTSPAISIEPVTAILSALGLMTRRRIRHLPVVDGGRMVGFVSIGDLVKARIDRAEEEANAMREYIQSA